LDDFEGTLVGADSTAFAVVIVYFWQVCRVEFNAGFRAVYPADLATGAFFSVYDGAERSPRPCLARAGDAWA